MDIPNSPVELMQRVLFDQLDSLPEDSAVQIPAGALRHLYVNYRDAIDLINEQQQIINGLIENS